MKRCPKCHRVETDEALRFCRVDGATLVICSSSMDQEAGTVKLGSRSGASGTATGILPLATDQNIDRATAPTTVLPAQPLTSATGAFAKPLKRKTGIIVAVGVVAVFAVVVAFVVNSYLSRKSTAAIESIAVLPFENKSGNPDSEYLSDGLAESLIYRLSQLPNLKVSPTSSVFRYKGKATDPQVIARELGVDSVMTGRITQRGDSLTLSVNLVDARNNKSLWGEQYERKMSELLQTQREMAAEITNKLQLKLTGEGEQKLAKKYTDNNEAYQLYLKGRYFWNKRTPESLRRAVELYKQAIEKDPSFALALTGMAETYVLFPFYGVAAARESMPPAKAAIERALAIDDSLAEAHGARGKYLAFFEYDRAGSEREFRRAIELNPRYATAHQWLGLDFLVLTKRFDEGIRELRVAGELDPLSSVIGSDLAQALVYAGRFDEAIEQAKNTLALNPDFAYAYATLGYALDGKGQFSEAIKEYRKSIELSDDPITRALLIRSLVKSGKREEAERELAALKVLSKASYVPYFSFAIAYTALGNKETAIAMLEKDVEERSSYVVTIGIERALDELRDEPRFRDLLKRMNLPE